MNIRRPKALLRAEDSNARAATMQARCEQCALISHGWAVAFFFDITSHGQTVADQKNNLHFYGSHAIVRSVCLNARRSNGVRLSLVLSFCKNLPLCSEQSLF